MWVGLLDSEQRAYHPSVISRVDSDLIRWRIDAAPDRSALLVRSGVLVFEVHAHLTEAPAYYAFFRNIDDEETFFVPVELHKTCVNDLQPKSSLSLELTMTTPLTANENASSP